MTPGALYQFQPGQKAMTLTGQMRLFEVDEIPSQYKLGAARRRMFTYIVAAVLALSVAAGVTFFIIRSSKETAPETGKLDYLVRRMPDLPGAVDDRDLAKMKPNEIPPGPWDPGLLKDDDGRWYLYWGSSNVFPIYGIEIAFEGNKLIYKGEADGMLCGTFGTHALHLHYVDQVIGLAPGVRRYAAMNALVMTNRTVFICDTYVTPDPDAPPVFWSTRDPKVIRKWAAIHEAEPATGEATSSGHRSSMSVDDGGSGLRFNFPGASRFREISWDEWFEHFGRHDLVFVCDDPEGAMLPGASYRLVRARDLATTRDDCG